MILVEGSTAHNAGLTQGPCLEVLKHADLYGQRADDPLAMYRADVFTVSVNLAGLPGLALPCGMTSERLPIGLQLIGRPLDEETLLRTGDAFQRETDWHTAAPPL